MDDKSHKPDHNRRSFLFKAMAGGSIIMSLLLYWILQWIMRKTEEVRRKRKLERYKASPIYPYQKD